MPPSTDTSFPAAPCWLSLIHILFEQEPLPLDHPFLTMENVVLTPHMGAATQDSVIRCTTTSCEEIVQVLNGQPVAFPGNKL